MEFLNAARVFKGRGLSELTEGVCRQRKERGPVLYFQSVGLLMSDFRWMQMLSLVLMPPTNLTKIRNSTNRKLFLASH